MGLHTEMYFANNPTEEDAFVLSVQKSSLSVIVPRFGIEGTVRGMLIALMVWNFEMYSPFPPRIVDLPRKRV